MAYATPGDFMAYWGTVPAGIVHDVPRALQVASDVLDASVFVPTHTLDDGDPPEGNVADGLRAATVRMVEYWIELGGGDRIDMSAYILGLGGQTITAGQVTLDLPDGLPPGVEVQLKKYGLWTGGAVPSLSTADYGFGYPGGWPV